ncbi:putative polysaccharide biosynthesis protein [Lachnoanaerobaculum saburreum]|uniref:Polysaccharide biosynthesis protein n=1 Tax=Lachnoanaerobaculum saburreum DSM 3986 TaxID=887325 RepID=E6LN70_9FIRM|nr:polysaccharide biosynthesis protein [Lachnoanaerobaculum saburreum]EFU76702.1 polysaccharide biosynthesis protein [Lachnoanaerobaculum saburreum DSM 3986]
MPGKNKKSESNDFLIQGAILAIAGILVRLIGLAYRVPLLRIIGAEGMGYYSTAYNLYAIILLLSSYSLPLAVSKMVSARIAKNEYRNASKILRAALIYATIVGGIGFGIIFFGANFFASSLYQIPPAKYALKSLAPTIWIMAYLGVLRGYFQGHSTMVPTALSQIFEQIVNAVVSVGAAYYLCEMAVRGAKGDEVRAAFGAAGGTIGTGAGTVIALFVMLICFCFTAKDRIKEIKGDRLSKKESFSVITRILILTVIPVIASTAIYNINSVLDGMVFGQSMKALGLEEETSKLYGIYTGGYLVLVNVPVAIANAMSSSLIPTVSKSFSRGDKGDVNLKISTVIRFATIVSFPCAIGLAVISIPVMKILFTNTEDAMLASYLMIIGSGIVVLYSVSTVTNAILQGTNLINKPVKNAFISLIIHFIILYILLFTLKLNIIGLVFGNMVFALSMCILNARSIRKNLYYKQEIIKTFLMPFICAGVMGIIVYMVYCYTSVKTNSRLMQTAIPILVGAPVYAILLIVTKTITKNEILQMPMGRRMVNILQKVRLLK